jgi:hypothetical protein
MSKWRTWIRKNNIIFIILEITQNFNSLELSNNKHF